MMIKSTKTLILLGAVTFGVSACDGQEAPEAAQTQDAQDASSAEEVKIFRDAGEMAICASKCADNHCAYAMGICLRATAECGGEGDCEAGYENCAEQFIAPTCAVEELELAGALTCWNTFQGCLADSDDSVGCVADLQACAQEGCGDEGCEEVSFAKGNVWPEPEKFSPEGRP